MSDNDNEIISIKYNPNFTQQELANKFVIGQSTVADILAQLLYWLGLKKWFDLALENHLTITGLILQEKAKQVVAALNIQNFAASDTHCSEATSALIERLLEFHLSLQIETSNYDPIDIYNYDKTALYWLLELSKSLTHGSISGIKKPKNQVTIILTCNAVGDKLLPFFYS
ncbi:18763_t:CDS:2 [Dentiscutata erythropus]|uniref:18763_t:CDS:1 n=1 Tax=Dentiscutata erythropus TaxID=1348616 RepID=A0A9N8YSQ6_9GLOM|nr:18763_t:CDS:2 [Dentiscutata erythropus]